MQAIDISELTPKGQELLSRIQSGEVLFITAEDKPVAKITPLGKKTKLSKRQKKKQAYRIAKIIQLYRKTEGMSELEKEAAYQIAKIIQLGEKAQPAPGRVE
ncbi:MAG TPA: hypothetical protein VFD58_10625 [Blastocatellia bacterium]|nr:hypothetical protein [Blastocatellia bacterium]